MAEQILISNSDLICVAPVGEIDMQTSDQFASLLQRAVEDGTKDIDLSFADVSFLDSRGISVIIDCANQAAKNNITIHVRGAKGEVKRILEISGILGTVVSEESITSSPAQQ